MQNYVFGFSEEETRLRITVSQKVDEILKRSLAWTQPERCDRHPNVEYAISHLVALLTMNNCRGLREMASRISEWRIIAGILDGVAFQIDLLVNGGVIQGKVGTPYPFADE